MIVSFLETSTHDLALENGNLVLCGDARAVAQHVVSRLRFFLGEWFLDLREGVPYWTEVFIKNPDTSVVRSLLTNVVTETPGVKEVTQSDFTYDSQTRTLRWALNFDDDTGQSVELSNSFIIPRP